MHASHNPKARTSMSNRTLHGSLHHPAQRDWSEPHIHCSQLMYPLFVTSRNEDKLIKGLEPNMQWGRGTDGSFKTLIEHLTELQTKGLRSVMLFGVVEQKDAVGSLADADDTPVVECIRALRRGCPDLLIACDACLCEYTDHGHCGVLRDVEGELVIDNARSVERLVSACICYAKAGAHMMCPSDMMDGRIGAIRKALDEGNFNHVSVMAYTSKKASCMYAPFRDAVESTFKGDRKRYQHPVGSTTHGMQALERDLAQGADSVIVKPSLFYGDMVHRFAEKGNVPVVCYLVSGEYKMIKDYGDSTGSFESVVKEAHVGLLRAGATLLITYFTPYILEKWTTW